jgi:hypothetical protein
MPPSSKNAAAKLSLRTRTSSPKQTRAGKGKASEQLQTQVGASTKDDVEKDEMPEEAVTNIYPREVYVTSCLE